MVHTAKIIQAEIMSCLDPRALSTAQTADIKVETCKIAKVQTKEISETRAVILNGSQSQKTFTSHKQHLLLHKMVSKIRM